jgi:hypothetical protein
MDPVSRISPWYVTGLLEGLGSFVCTASGRGLQLSFELALPGTDAALLADLRASLGGLGRILPRRGGSRRALRITRRVELLRLVEHLEAYPLQGAHRRAFEPWAALVRQRAAAFRRPLPPAAWELAEQLRAAQPRRRGRHQRASKSKAALDERPARP